MKIRNAKVSFVKGMRADSLPDTVPVVATVNGELSPDGTEFHNREGIAIYGRYAITPPTGHEGRQIVVLESQMPGKTDGTMGVMVINHGRNNRMTHLDLFRPHTSIAGSTLVSTLSFEEESYEVANGDNAVLTVLRTGAIDQVVSVSYATSNDSALAGTDYTATSGTLTFNAGDTSKTITVPTTATGAIPKKVFHVELSDQGSSSVIEGPNPVPVILRGDPMERMMPLIGCNATKTQDSGYHTGGLCVYSATANDLVYHYLKLKNYTGAANKAYRGWRISDSIVAIADVLRTDKKVYFLDLENMVLGGGAYSQGGAVMATAIVRQPVSTLEWTSTLSNIDLTYSYPWHHQIASSGKYLYLFDRTPSAGTPTHIRIEKINCVSYELEETLSVSMVASGRTPTNFAQLLTIDQDGYLICSWGETDGGATKYNRFVKIDPTDGSKIVEVVYASVATWGGGGTGRDIFECVHLDSGDYILQPLNTSASTTFRLNSSLASPTTLGALPADPGSGVWRLMPHFGGVGNVCYFAAWNTGVADTTFQYVRMTSAEGTPSNTAYTVAGAAVNSQTSGGLYYAFRRSSTEGIALQHPNQSQSFARINITNGTLTAEINDVDRHSGQTLDTKLHGGSTDTLPADRVQWYSPGRWFELNAAGSLETAE